MPTGGHRDHFPFGYQLLPEYAAHDARLHFPSDKDEARPRRGEMPPGCDCARVILGKVLPTDCRLSGSACTPESAIGHVWFRTKARVTCGGALAIGRMPDPD